MPGILMIAGDFTEDYEVMIPFQTLSTIGVDVHVACPRKRRGDSIITAIHDFEGFQIYTEKPGHRFVLNASFDALILEHYCGLFLTKDVVHIVRWFMARNLPIAAICHGVQILAAADVIRGRTLTAYCAVEPEIVSAGGRYIAMRPDQAYVDGNLITSPAWPGNVAILREFIKSLGVRIS